jgi:hypothetical protein
MTRGWVWDKRHGYDSRCNNDVCGGREGTREAKREPMNINGER